MLKQKGNRAFTLIEILVVIVIIIIFVIFAAPNVAKYITDSEVRQEVYRLVKYIERKKAETVAGKYAMTRIWISDKPASGKSKDWQMSNEEWNRQMANGQLSSRACPGPKSQYTNTNSSDTFEWDHSKVISSRKHLCIDREGIISTDGENQNGIQEKAFIIVCSTSNTGPDYNSLCYWNRKKLPYRYIITVGLGTKIKVYKYNLKKDKWILQ